MATMATMEKIDEILATTRDAITVDRVFGEPYERDGVTYLPAASVRGGGGGGEGDAGPDEGGGRGAGFGLAGRPAGVYRIAGDDVRWVPAIDATKVILMGQVVAIVALLVVRSLLRRR